MQYNHGFILLCQLLLLFLPLNCRYKLFTVAGQDSTQSFSRQVTLNELDDLIMLFLGLTLFH